MAPYDFQVAPGLTERVYSPREAAERLGVTRQTVRVLVQSGRLKWTSHDGGRHFLRVRDVENFARVYKPDPNKQIHVRRVRRFDPRVAVAVKLIQEGATIADVMRETACTPDFALELWKATHASFQKLQAEAEQAERERRAERALERAEEREERRLEREAKKEVAIESVRLSTRAARSVKRSA